MQSIFSDHILLGAIVTAVKKTDNILALGDRVYRLIGKTDNK